MVYITLNAICSCGGKGGSGGGEKWAKEKIRKWIDRHNKKPEETRPQC